MHYVLFTDNLADLSITEVCREVKRAGFDGLDLTLRPGGHVPPENAEMGLAAARQAADAEGIDIPMASTAVTDADSPHAEQVFASAAHYGVRRLKLGYWGYSPFGTLGKQLDDARAKLASVVKLGRQYGVLPCIHVHSGRILSNGGAFVYLILKDFAPDEAAAYVDPMHMTLEGGNAGWEMGLDLLAPWVGLVGMKNFRWLGEGQRDERGQMRYTWHYTPLADGTAPLPEFVDYLKQLGYDGVVSLHSEYKGNSFRRLDTPELLVQSAADLAYLKTLVGA